MEIISAETTCTFNNGFTVKKVTAKIGGDSDIDFVIPEVKKFSALYKNEKPVGIVTGKNKTDGIIVPTLLKVDLIGKGNKFAIFNVKDGKIIYRGEGSALGTDVTFTESGFIVKKMVEVKSGFDFNGKNKGTKIMHENNLITIGEVLDSIENNEF